MQIIRRLEWSPRLDSNTDARFLIQWRVLKALRKEEEVLEDEISIRFAAALCRGDPVITGLRLIEDDQEAVQWTEKVRRR
jgi:hypothetical protein